MKKYDLIEKLGMVVIILIVFTVLFKSCEEYNDIAKECDKYHGYACSHYQVEQFMIRKGGN